MADFFSLFSNYMVLFYENIFANDRDNTTVANALPFLNFSRQVNIWEQKSEVKEESDQEWHWILKILKRYSYIDLILCAKIINSELFHCLAHLCR